MAFQKKSAVRLQLIELFEHVPQLVTDGISSFTLEVPLARNAVVSKFDVIIQAKRAAGTAVQEVAQVRVNPTGGGRMAIVLDFGTPRTVSAVQVPIPSSLQISKATSWIGTGFAKDPVATTANSSDQTVIFASEIRTERLLVEVVGGTESAGRLGSEMTVILPEAPADLELRIDGGAPAFKHPGPAQSGSAEPPPSDHEWNKKGERIVHLADALAKLTGDPTKSDVVNFKLVLSSRVPGVLKILRGAAEDESVAYVRRALFGSESAKDLVFTEEGQVSVPLANFVTKERIDADAAIQEVRFTAVGNLPPERVVPAVGPDDAGQADLVVNSGRAGIVRLQSDTGLTELVGVRLPLRAAAGGAEARVVLWRNKSESTLDPVEAIPQGVSDPVTLEESSAEAWKTFAFKHPVPLDRKNPPWAALLVSRGEVTWALGAGTGTEGAVRRGAPDGPWLPLPRPLVTGTAELARVRGRIRAIGHALKETPLAPVVVAVGGMSSDVTPTAKGAPYKLAFSAETRPALAKAALSVTSRVAGTVTLRDVDVVATK